MEEIAAKAGINKAMLYYYYSTRDLLYREVLISVVVKVGLFVASQPSLAQARDARSKLEQFIDLHFDLLSKDPIPARILFQALANEPDDLQQAIKTLHQNTEGEPDIPGRLLVSTLEEGIRSGEFWDLDPKQFAVSFFGMLLTYATGTSIIDTLLNQTVRDPDVFWKERKKAVKDLLLHGVLKRVPPPG
jgi:TetR/AcrR family transcriptional regulator